MEECEVKLHEKCHKKLLFNLGCGIFFINIFCRKFDSIFFNGKIFNFISQEHAFESSQKYKEGKYIIELAHMIKENNYGV